MCDYIYLCNNLVESLKELYEKDKYLISHGSPDKDQHVSEMSIVFRLGIYLNRRIESWLAENGYSLDIEYNRNEDDIKCLDFGTSGELKPVRPDMIIHERGSNQNNILIIEFKTWWYSDDSAISHDREKLIKYTRTDGLLKYHDGLLVILGSNIHSVNYEHYQNGQQLPNDQNE